MPSGTANKEDKAKLDAALAIAALSNGSWDRVELRAPEADPNSRQTAAHKKRGGLRKPQKRPSSSNGSHVLAPVMPAREKNFAKRKRTSQELFSDVSENEIPELQQTAAGDYLQGGKFVRSAKQTVHNSLASPGGSLYGSSEISFNMQSSLCSLKSTLANAVTVTDDGTQSEQTNGFVMMDLTSLLESGILVPVIPAGSVGQSGDAGQRTPSAQVISDPHLLQLLCQQGNFIAVSIPNSPNPNPAAAEDLDNSLSDSVLAAAASPPCPAQLPGSLSTLRNYYNTTNASDPLADGQPAAKIEDLSASKIHLTSQQATPGSNSYHSMNDQFLKMRLASMDVSSIGSHGILRLAGDSSPSTFSSDTTAAAVGISSNLISMPGSLSILRSYYSSLDQKRNVKQNESIRSSADHKISPVRTTDVQLSWEMSDSALNLSKNRQGDQKDIPGIPGINATDVVQPGFWPEEQSTGLAVNLKKTLMTSANNGQYPSSPYVLGSSPGPFRILPRISESCTLNAASPMSSLFSDEQKRPDSVASSLSSVHLPPKKRRKVVSSDPVETPLDACSIVLGDEKVPLSVFMSRLDSTARQIVINQIQSVIKVQQTLAPCPAEVPSKVPVISSQLNMALLSPAASTGAPSCDMNINASLNSKEAETCTEFSFSNSAPSPDIRLLDIGITYEKKTAQVPAKNGKDGADQKEYHSDGTESLQLPRSSSSSSQLSLSSLSRQFLHPVLQPDEDGDLPLHVAVAQGEINVVERVVCMMRQLNATIDCRNFLRQTPLHVAVVTGECEIVTCLLEAGASPNIADRNGQNCFHLAVQYKQVKCLEILFSCTESRPDLLNYEGMTPLHLAVKLNLPDAVSVLLRHGVHADAIDGKSGHTALYMAADANRFKVAEILLSCGANAQIASYSGCSPVQAASSKSFHEMVKLLMKYGGTSDSAVAERSSDSKDSSEFGANILRGKV